MSAPPAAVPQLLQDPRCVELHARWTGDPVVDAGLAHPSAREAVTQLFGADRATRAVVGGFARSLVGPDGQQPGRNAAVFATSVLLAVDTDARDGRLAADDLATVLVASCDPTVPTRRGLVPAPVRALFRVLMHAWPRHWRRDVALELLRDEHGGTDELLGSLRSLCAAPEVVFPAPGVGLEQLREHVRRLVTDLRVFAPDATPAGVVAFRTRPRILLDDGFEVRVPVIPAHTVGEADRFANCLASRWSAIELHHRLVATVHRGLQPVAAIELDRAGDIVELLGPANRPLGRDQQDLVEGVLLRAGVLDQRVPDRPRGPAEEVAARIACRAAVLLVDELEPELDQWDTAEPGAAALRLLGSRAELLTDAEQYALRVPAPDPARDGADDEVHGWQIIATMLAASHLDDPRIEVIGGGAPCRRAARGHARRILANTLTLEERPPASGLRYLAHDPTVPAAVRIGVGEVLDRWRPRR